MRLIVDTTRDQFFLPQAAVRLGRYTVPKTLIARGIPPMSHRFDATLKDIVAEHPSHFALVFGLPANEPATALNVDLSTISAATDVALGYGKPIHRIVDLNFQSGPDPGLPRRLHHYNAALHDRHDLPVHSILVLLRPKADAPNLTGKLTYGDADCRLEFGYRIICLWVSLGFPFGFPTW